MYSTNTLLAYAINQKFYREKHYVWCSSFTGINQYLSIEQFTPPSSSPFGIYKRLCEDIKGRDEHSDKIHKNKIGIKKGAEAKRLSGEIDDMTEKNIYLAVDKASRDDFRPLIYVIPLYLVKKDIVNVDPSEKAHALSDEYRIHALHRKNFDIIEIPL